MLHPLSRPEQLCLPGLDPAPTDRLFFAVFPDEAVANGVRDAVKELHGKLRLSGKPLTAKQLHVSLHHLGDYAGGLPGEIVGKAIKAAASIVHSSFTIGFDRIGSFMGRRGNRPLVLRGGGAVIPLMAFQHKLGEAMTEVGLGQLVAPQFTPHMTLLYDPRYVEAETVASVNSIVRDFVLVHTQPGKTTHLPLARFPLRAAEMEEA
jgi:2'-5' RNA ligase